MARPKVIISTDLGGGDKDDGQSLIHALLYANDVDYRGIVITRSDDGGSGGIGNGKAMAREIVDAYGRDLANLRETDADYPGATALRGLITDGATKSAWPGGLSDGARLIIEEARDASPKDPLYVLTWGPIHDAARALYEAPDIVDSVRILSIAGYGQDKAHPQAYRWLVNAIDDNPRYRDVWLVDSAETFRGIHINAKGEKAPGIFLDWVKENAKGHGALGDLLHDDYTYELYGRANSPDGLKMGDTPSLLYLLDTVDNDNPGAASWGGSFKKSGIGPNYWVDRTDSGSRVGQFDGARTVLDKRGAVLRDFAERLDAADGRGGKSGGPEPETPRPPAPETPMPPERPTGGSEIGSGRTEAEALDLDGYSVHSGSRYSGDRVIKAEGTGTAKGTFDGPAGTYRLEIGYLNETDGASTWTVMVDGRTLESWRGTGGRNAVETETVSVALEPGDTIAIEGQRQAGEHARVDYIDVQRTGGKTPAPSEKPGTPPPAPETSRGGADDAIGAGRTEMEDLSLRGYEEMARSNASGGAWIKADGKGTASGTFEGKSGSYDADIFYFNETDGSSDWRMLVEGKTVAAWDGRGGRNSMERIEVEVDLDHGDTIAFAGARGGGEHARLDALMLTPAEDFFG